MADYFHYEMKRLKKVSFELPDIYSFRVRFSAEEGFWLKYITIDYPKILFHKLSKLSSLDRYNYNSGCKNTITQTIMMAL
ncbi:MAG: hypothetical protein ACTSSK_15705 [Candidatus Heimdallarchaeota archaeon]